MTPSITTFTHGLFLSLLYILQAQAAYPIAQDYSGSNFFNEWYFYGSYDNLTSGDVQYLSQANATAQKLAYVNANGNAIIRVDNFTNVPYNEKRNSVRIESTATYGVGSVWIMDALHMPYGCSVWPSFWTHGDAWPQQGEIDIVEAVNAMGNNQMALHTNDGCFKADAPEIGRVMGTNCSTGAGCVVAETKPNSYGDGFTQAGGGVFATQFDVSGIYIWFWSRNDIPQSIKQSTATSPIDLSDWGTPSASYPASGCDIGSYFKAQRLTITITLCGVWAGLPDIYSATCTLSGPQGSCYLDNVIGPGSPRYDNAFFEIQYIRAYGLNASSSTTGNPSPSSTGATPTGTRSVGQLTSVPSNSGARKLLAMGCSGPLLCIPFVMSLLPFLYMFLA